MALPEHQAWTLNKPGEVRQGGGREERWGAEHRKEAEKVLSTFLRG